MINRGLRYQNGNMLQTCLAADLSCNARMYIMARPAESPGLARDNG